MPIETTRVLTIAYLYKYKMYIPSMPSITDLPKEELRNPTAAFKVLEENLGEIVNPDGDGNYGYYSIFEALSF